MADKPRCCLPLTLRSLVWALKCLGLLCFKWSPSPASSGRAEISVPLLLWAIFIKTFQITQIVSLTVSVGGTNVGDVTRFVAFTVSIISIIVGQILLVINGPILFDILSECEPEALKEVRKSVKKFSRERIMNILLYFSNTAGIFMTIFCTFYENSGTVLYNYVPVVFCFFFCPVIISNMLIVMLFREVLTIASSKLSVDFASLDECRTDAFGADWTLCSLERKIHKMELLRGKIVDWLLAVISLTLCINTFMVIFSLFTTIRNLMADTTTFDTVLVVYCLFFMVAISSLVHLCYSGHYFSQHVRHVSGQLRELRMKVHGQRDMAQACHVPGQLEELIRGQEYRAQLQYLISTLERMETFDMGSWYRLSPNTLVSLAIFIVTYVVVLLQVGGQQTHTIPSMK